MNRTLVIAPQWIGDAVMAEPLLATLAEGGDRLTVAALPWVAPVFSAMPEVAEIVELPFAHGRLDWAARRRVAAQWRDRFDVAYVLPNSLKSALVPWLARIPERVGYAAEGRSPLLSRRLVRAGRAPADGRVLRRARRRRLRQPPATATSPRAGPARRHDDAARAAARALLDLRAGRRIRPGQALAARRTTRRSRARSTPPTARRSRCSARPAKPICVPRSRRRPAMPAASSPAARRCSTRSR